MNIKITLEDESLCRGCPLGNGLMKCQAGFTREMGKLFETEDRGSVYVYDYNSVPKRTIFDFVRPQACVLSTEQVVKVIERIKEKK